MGDSYRPQIFALPSGARVRVSDSCVWASEGAFCARPPARAVFSDARRRAARRALLLLLKATGEPLRAGEGACGGRGCPE